MGMDALYLYNNCKLCAKHFTDNCFCNPYKKKQLTENAIPTIFVWKTGVKRKLFENVTGIYIIILLRNRK